MIPTPQSRESQQSRLESKTQDRQLINRVVEGTGMSPWEAEILVEVVQEVYFSDPAHAPLRSGHIRYDCIRITEGAGKPIKHCQMVSVVLSLVEKEDAQLITQFGLKGLRQARILRITEEARDQGGVLTQEDLALLLGCDARTVRRDARELREQKGIFLPTRGQVKDIGPGVTHKGVAIRLWLEGKEPVEIARHIHHTVKAVERYIHHFSRVVFLQRKGFAPLQIALTVGISSANVQTYLELYEGYRHKRDYQPRLQEMEIIGLEHYQVEDQKKGGLMPERNTRSEGRRP